MKAINAKKIGAALLSAAMCAAFACTSISQLQKPAMVSAETISDLPSEYQYAADWIWQNRVVAENSTGRRNTIFDQIIAGKGTINYVVKWQSYREVTLEQREQFEVLLSDSINAWTDYLVGYENWPYDHIDVKVVGWAVLDANCILDPQPDEIIYTDTKYYDSQYDTSNGVEEIPNLEPYAPDMLSRMYHFEHRYDPTFDLYNYPGGLDKRFDMYMWATQGFPAVGGCGGDWGQRLSDTAYLNMLGGAYNHVLVHEIGHGFGMTDFYGGEGASDGFPPGGFPGNGSSIMMAGSSSVITDFDGWFIRYMWTQIKDEEGRFDLANALPETTEPTTEEPTTEPPTETTTEEPTTIPTDMAMDARSFTDTIVARDGNSITFAEHGTYTFTEDHHGEDPAKNLAHYEVGDVVAIEFAYYTYTNEIFEVTNLTLVENVRKALGDVDADGSFTLTDIIMLQKWLLQAGEITDAAAGDLCTDGVLNGYDLAAMKNMYLQ